MKVPFLDLHTHHRAQRAEFSRAFESVVDLGAFAGGKFVEEFERDFALYCHADHAIGVGSGTDALWLALLAFGIGPGDEVITVPNSFIATAEAISFTGAKPVFVDVDPITYNMDPGALESAITVRTRAIIPVHLFGQPANMDPILSIARERNLRVIEDAAQAHGAEYDGRRVGSLADAGCFSFYPGKNLGAFGEGGAVVTNDVELRDRIRKLRDHGQSKKYHHGVVGWNSRMDGIQGAVLQIKLRGLDEGNKLRHSHALRYDEAFSGVDGITVPERGSNVGHVYHIYAIQVPQRDEIMRYLNSKEIGCGIHYPVPIHLQEAYRDLGYARGAFPVAERSAERFLSLPMFPELTHSQLDEVIEVVHDGLKSVGD